VNREAENREGFDARLADLLKGGYNESVYTFRRNSTEPVHVGRVADPAQPTSNARSWSIGIKT
jgi:hypothetical protein